MEKIDANNYSDMKVETEPPKTSIGVIGWVRENLFSSWFNTLLTIIFIVLIYLGVKNTLKWAFSSAKWGVISSNFQLFFVGQFPTDQLWRVWLSLALISVLFGFSAGLWKGTLRRLSFFFSAILLVIISLPFVTLYTRIWLFINILLIIIGYFGVSILPKKVTITIVGWLLSFPMIILLLNGFGVYKSISTNLWGGLLLTILISIVALALSFPIGILLALGRMSRFPVIKWFSIAYIELIRGVPLITVLFIGQLMIPLFLPEGIEINNVIRAMIGFTLFTAAYLAENVRGGLQSIPRGQFEAAKAIGLNSTYTMIFIILPQALRAVIPAIVGQSIAMFKDTSLISIVGLFDLVGISKTIAANPKFLGKQMEVFLFIALIYWIISYSMSYGSRRLEKSLGVGER